MKLKQLIKSTGREVLYQNSFLRNIYVNNRFSREIRLINDKHEGSKYHQSILIFTLSKCASVYVRKTLERLYKDTDITVVNIGEYLRMAGLPKIDKISRLDDKIFKEKIKNSFKPLGYLYAVLRAPQVLELVDNKQDYKIVLILRDPRELLVSAYFSFGYTHSLPIVKSKREEFLAQRNKIINQTLDEYVLENKDYWLEQYHYYCRELIGKPNVLFLKCENMISNLDKWLNSLIEFSNIDINQQNLNQIINEAKQKQVKPIGKKTRLKPETVAILNSEFREVLDLLDYQ